jgi:hypothetical protein
MLAKANHHPFRATLHRLNLTDFGDWRARQRTSTNARSVFGKSSVTLLALRRVQSVAHTARRTLLKKYKWNSDGCNQTNRTNHQADIKTRIQ